PVERLGERDDTVVLAAVGAPFRRVLRPPYGAARQGRSGQSAAAAAAVPKPPRQTDRSVRGEKSREIDRGLERDLPPELRAQRNGPVGERPPQRETERARSSERQRGKGDDQVDET